MGTQVKPENRGREEEREDEREEEREEEDVLDLHCAAF